MQHMGGSGTAVLYIYMTHGSWRLNIKPTAISVEHNQWE